MLRCPVCQASGARLFLHVDARDYWRCGTCEATFVDPAMRPTPEAEQVQYRLHRNAPDDEGYRQFLSRLAAPLLQRLPPAQSGLDYGCGPGPVLAAMLRDAGHTMALYDPLFCPDPAALAGSYDFVTCTETAEHFHDPAREFARLDSLLKPGGLLAVMTSFLTDNVAFANWHYRRDLTHVVFYRQATFFHLARQHRWQCEIAGPNVAFLRKQLDGDLVPQPTDP